MIGAPGADVSRSGRPSIHNEIWAANRPETGPEAAQIAVQMVAVERRVMNSTPPPASSNAAATIAITPVELPVWGN